MTRILRVTNTRTLISGLKPSSSMRMPLLLNKSRETGKLTQTVRSLSHLSIISSQRRMFRDLMTSDKVTELNEQSDGEGVDRR